MTTTEHVRVVRTESVPVDSISPHPQNPRRGDMARIEHSLRTHGQYQDIVVHEETGHILVGNHRWRAAKDKLGWTHINVKFVSCTNAKALEILAMDNRSSDDGRYDDTALLALLEEISSDGMLANAGYGAEELDDLLARLEEDAPAFTDEAPTMRSLEDKATTYDASPTRMVVLTYPLEDFSYVVAALERVAERLGVESNADVVLALLREAEEA